MSPRDKNVCNQVKNLVIAQHNFKVALTLSRHLKDLRLKPYEDLFSGIFTGIATSYSRNFTKNTGVANYKDEQRFTTFDKLNLQETHDYLLELRSKLYAHIDVPHLRSKNISSIGEVEPYEVEVTIQDGGILLRPCMVANNETLLDFIIELCQNQIQTFELAITEKLSLFEAHNDYRIGETLILGQTFPKTKKD